MTLQAQATIRAGVPSLNKALYHQIRFACHDPVILIEIPSSTSPTQTTSASSRRILILRDVELARAKKPVSQGGARADEVHIYQDFTPASGLSGERETASAQSAAECLRRHKIRSIKADRSLPLLYWHYLRQVGIEVECDPNLGLLERRSKDSQEIEWLRKAQHVTEQAIKMACETIACAPVRSDGILLDPTLGNTTSTPLTSERVKALIDLFLSQHAFTSTGHIVAGGPQGSDCHDAGSGLLRTLEPIIVDVFPCDSSSLYHGDCTRMVVNVPPSGGDIHSRSEHNIPPQILRMHQAVLDAKADAIAAIRAGVTGEDVHKAAIAQIQAHGFGLGFDAIHTTGSMPHGTGHGLGLDLKEPPLLDFKGPSLIPGDAVTVEPGIYWSNVGGMRLEDLVIVTPSGCTNLNTLHQGLVWN